MRKLTGCRDNFCIAASFGPGSTGPTPRRPRKHNVAPERGASGLDEEYLFSPHSGRPDSGFSNKENFFTDDGRSYKEESDYDLDGEIF